jgi:hypothetical protein
VTSRAGVMRLLWAAVRRLGVGGEEALRAGVRRLNERDRTNVEVKGTTSYESTRLLSQEQLFELADEFRRRARLPAASKRARGARGGRPRRPNHLEGVTFLASRGEVEYIEYLFELLKWSEDAVRKFISRQTKGVGLTTHTACTAVSAPLERMLRARGYELLEHDRVKRWVAPSPPEGGST